jgi:hypothetical protein
MSRLRQIAVAVLAAAGLAVAIWQLGGHYPLDKWLFWIYLEIWTLCGFWALACLAGGHAVLRRVVGPSLPLRQQALYAFAIGVLAFALGIFFIGLAHGLNAVTFFAWPAVMIAAGGRTFWRSGRRAVRHIRWARARPGLSRSSPAGYALFALGALGVLALYLNVLTPHNLAYDSRWYHIAVAEHYAADHAVARFPEGWFQGAVPQLASYVYTWAFMLPGASLFTHVELATHLEMTLFLATLAGLPLLVRWLLGGASAPLSWVALFLFPGIFVYDSSLSGAADHVLAFWAPPLFLCAGRLWRSWSRADAVLLALLASGAALTKYQAIYLVVPIAIGIGVRAVVVGWRQRSLWRSPLRSLRAAVVPLAVFAGVCLALTAVHWLKNVIWYGDPMYPALYKHLTLRPWNPDADPVFNLQPPDFMVSGTLGHKLKETTQALATFAFRPHDWERFHRDWPVFGFLFTLLVPMVLVLPGARRPRALAAATILGVAIWYWTLHEDRYLQALVPWMAATVAAVIWRLWRAGWLARLSIVPLVALQVIWSGDHYALSKHVMIGQQPMRVTMDLLAGGYEGRGDERFGVPTDLAAAGKALPKDARALFHEQHLRLGLGRPIITDSRGNQGALSYRRMRSPREVWEKLRALGVTHVLSPASPWSIETWGDETVFYDFAFKYLVGAKSYEGVRMGALPATPPPDRPYGAVAILGCAANHRTTLAEVDKAIFIATPAPSPAEIAAIEKDADFILIETACRTRLPTANGYQLATTRAGWETWVKVP